MRNLKEPLVYAKRHGRGSIDMRLIKFVNVLGRRYAHEHRIQAFKIN